MCNFNPSMSAERPRPTDSLRFRYTSTAEKEYTHHWQRRRAHFLAYISLAWAWIVNDHWWGRVYVMTRLSELDSENPKPHRFRLSILHPAMVNSSRSTMDNTDAAFALGLFVEPNVLRIVSSSISSNPCSPWKPCSVHPPLGPRVRGRHCKMFGPCTTLYRGNLQPTKANLCDTLPIASAFCLLLSLLALLTGLWNGWELAIAVRTGFFT